MGIISDGVIRWDGWEIWVLVVLMIICTTVCATGATYDERGLDAIGWGIWGGFVGVVIGAVIFVVIKIVVSIGVEIIPTPGGQALFWLTVTSVVIGTVVGIVQAIRNR